MDQNEWANAQYNAVFRGLGVTQYGLNAAGGLSNRNIDSREFYAGAQSNAKPTPKHTYTPERQRIANPPPIAIWTRS